MVNPPTVGVARFWIVSSFMSTFSTDPQKLEELLNYCTEFARQMIRENGEFHPFGAVIDSNGQLMAVGASAGEVIPEEAELYGFLQNSMKSQFLNGEIVACAIAANVNLPAQLESRFPDGIRVLVECAGYSRFNYLPYAISGERVEYGEFISVDVPATICPGGDEA